VVCPRGRGGCAVLRNRVSRFARRPCHDDACRVAGRAARFRRRRGVHALRPGFHVDQRRPHHEFNDAVSFLVNCDSQAELDRYWNALLKSGGKPQACGWIIDKYGLRWQIVPTVLGEMMVSQDKAKAKRVTEEMLKQAKFDIAKLEAAFNGR
jgi:hypothetical protein